MEIVPTTALAAAAVAVIAWLGPRRGLWAFFALTPLGAAAALNLPSLGGASIVLADMAAVALFAAALTRAGAPGRLLATMRPPRPGFLLVALLAFGAFATVFFPRVFAGQTEVFLVSRVAGEAGVVSRPLRFTNGNVTQLLRLTLGAMVFLTLATVFRREPDPRAVVVALAADAVVHWTAGLLDVLSYSAGMPQLLEPIRTANYAMAVTQVMAGLKRMVGGFPEASSFGYHTVGLFGFWLQYWFDGGRFRYAAWFILATTAVLILSTSSSAYVAAALFGGAFVAVNSARIVKRDVGLRVAWILGGLAAATPVAGAGLAVAYQTVPEFAAYLDRLLFNKLTSSSGVERMSWNMQALRNFADTWAIGTGLGSVRASNWLVACLASLGLLGTGLYLVFIASVFRAAPPERLGETAVVARALKMGCLALLAQAMLTTATPNLELGFFAMAGLAVGLAAGARAAARGPVAPTAPGPDEGHLGQRQVHRRAAQRGAPDGGALRGGAP